MKESHNWTPIYEIKVLEPGTAVLFRYGTGPAEKVEIAFIVDVGDGNLKVVAKKDGWARDLKTFTNSGALIGKNGEVLGRLFRQFVLEIPERFLSPDQLAEKKTKQKPASGESAG